MLGASFPAILGPESIHPRCRKSSPSRLPIKTAMTTSNAQPPSNGARRTRRPDHRLRRAILTAFAFGIALAPGAERRAHAAGASGILDTSFGAAGVKAFSLGSLNDSARALALQPDGRILVAGYSTSGPVGNDDFVVVRLLPDGSFDTSFGGSGKVAVSVLSTLDRALAMALQPDGKIVLAGFARGSGIDSIAVVRLLPTGVVDTGFGVSGRVVTQVGVSDSRAQAVAIQSDGRIVVAGWARNSANRDVALVRYLSNGSLDPTFGMGGMLLQPIGTGNDEAYGLALDLAGRIVVVGQSAEGSRKDMVLARVLASGSVDQAFAANGIVRVRFRYGDSIANAATVDPAGRILAVGRARIGNLFRFAVVRVLSDGGLDASLTGAGRFTTGLGSFADARSVAAFADGRFVVGGVSRNSGNEDAVLARYDEDGALDTHFAGTGVVLVPLSWGPDSTSGVAVQSDGKIVAAGVTRRGNDDDFFLARYLVDDCGNGTVDLGEQCDAGEGHDQPCCSDSCTVLVAGTPCRAVADTCDLADACDGASGECTDVRKPDADGDLVCDEIDLCPAAADPGQEDGDGDGLGDACDPCTSGAAVLAGRLALSGFLTDPGDDSMRFTGRFAIPTATALDPRTRGMRLVVEDALGKVLLDKTLPAGAWNEASGRGWTRSTSGRVHKFADLSPGASVSFVRMRQPLSSPTLVRFSIRAEAGGFSVRPLAEPIRATVVLEPPRASGGACPQFAFGSPPTETCESDETGDELVCK